MKHYTQDLPDGISLAVFNGDTLIFTSREKWLHPLFAFEGFLATYTGPRDMLCAHDTAAGKAAAILMARLDIKRAHINLVSDLAKDVYEKHSITLSYERRIERLLCKTEQLLSSMDDEEKIYLLLKERADRAKEGALPI
jgi:zinc transport system ATP-binding protein